MADGSAGRRCGTAVIPAFLMLVFLLISCGPGSGRQTGYAAGQGFIPSGERKPAPAWEFQGLLREGSISAAGLSGKVVVIHFWASWCPPCKMEFPSFVRWAEGQPRDPDTVLIPVSIDENAEKGMSFYKGSGASAAAYHGSWKDAESFGISGIPATVVIDTNGKVAFLAEGALEWNENGVGAVLQALTREGKR